MRRGFLPLLLLPMAVAACLVGRAGPSHSRTWAPGGALQLPEGARTPHFGWTVALDGGTLAVGARCPCDWMNGADLAGAVRPGGVYIFVRQGDGWTQQAFLDAPRAADADHFGHALALHGDSLVVGAIGEDAGAGAAYVFRRSGGRWTEEARLTAARPDVWDNFGVAVAISGDTIAVGSHNGGGATGMNAPPPDRSLVLSGAVHVFTRADGKWTPEAFLLVSDADDNDQIGSALALAGDTLVVGAPYADAEIVDRTATDSGAVYVFTRAGRRWSQTAYLKASDAHEYGHFGASVALDGTTLVVGADRFDFADGSAYAFTGHGGTWTERAHLRPSDPGFELHGAEVAISGRTAVIAGIRASKQRRDDLEPTAELFVFTEDGGRWSQSRRIDVALPALPGDAPSGAEDQLAGFTHVAVAMTADTFALGLVAERFNRDDPVYCTRCPASGTYDRDVGAVTAFR